MSCLRLFYVFSGMREEINRIKFSYREVKNVAVSYSSVDGVRFLDRFRVFYLLGGRIRGFRE